MNKKGGLGKGMKALIDSGDRDIKKAVEEAEKNGVLEIDIKLIDMNPDQPRKIFDESEIKGLAESIKENGLINPITLREKDGKYQIISGERRFRAFKFLERNNVNWHNFLSKKLLPDDSIYVILNNTFYFLYIFYYLYVKIIELLFF